VLSTSILHQVSLKSIRHFKPFYMRMDRVAKLIHDYLFILFFTKLKLLSLVSI
jgi:hypothetical protein